MVDRQDDPSDVPKGGSLDEAIVEEFAAGFRGELISPEDDGYDEARKVYNGMIDKRPALIVRPTGAADVIDAVNLARENGLPLAVRCGGHSVSGKGVVDDGVLIDLSSLKGVRVDAGSRRARANAGTLWGSSTARPSSSGSPPREDELRRPVSAASRLEVATDGSRLSGG
jgi:hypothetical protein